MPDAHPAPLPPRRTYGGLTLGLFALLLLPSLLAPIHPAALLAIPALFAVFVARTLRGGGSVEVWAVRGLLLWEVLRFSTVGVSSPVVALAVQSVGVVSMVGLCIALFRRVVASGPVDAQRLFMAADTYLVAGFAFGALYQMVEVLQPGSFTALPDGPFAWSQALVYFSFMTQTTVGYGDISPVAPVARALTSLQATAGQLYLAILVGRLIGLHLGRGRADGDEPG